MKRLLFIPLLLLALSGYGQTIIRANSFYVAPAVAAAASYNAEYDTILAAYATAPHDTIKTIQNTLVDQLVDSGYWARMDLFYVFANDDGTDALINWIDPGTFDATNVSSTVFTAWNGFIGDAANDYIRTNYNPNDNKIHISLNSVTLAVYLQHDLASANGTIGAVQDGTHELSMYPDNSGNFYARMNCGGAYSGGACVGTGLLMVTRRSSTNVEGYKNGVHLVNDAANSSIGLPDEILDILAVTATSLSGSEVSIAFIMDAVSDAEALEINTIIERAMDKLYTGVEP